MDIVLFTFTDKWWDWERTGFASRTAELARELTLHPRVSNLLVVDVPTSHASRLLAPSPASGSSFRWTGGYRLAQSNKGAWVLDHSRVLPRERHVPLALALNACTHDRSLRRAVLAAMRQLGMKDVVSVHCGPLTMVHARKIGERLCVYDAVDDWLAHPGFTSMAGPLRRGYERVRQEADLITAVSQPLANLFEGGAARIRVLPNAAGETCPSEAQLAAGAVLEGLTRPIVGYVGAIQERVDVDLIGDLARALPHTSVCLVGPVLSERHVRPLRDIGNVHFLGPAVHSDVCGYLAAFDVCVMPHLDGPLTRCMDPVKLYEYVASGKPTVCSGVEVNSRFKGLVRCAMDREAFVREVRTALAGEWCAPEAEVARFVEANTWARRAEEFLELISPEGAASGPKSTAGQMGRAS